MNSRNFRVVGSLVRSRACRLKSVVKAGRKRSLEFFAGELEQRQLLATFAYNSLSGLLTVQTTSNSEQLSIISTSESGNYTITTSGSWSGSETDINASGASLYVNQPSGLASILINDNGGSVSGSSLGFGVSSANFVNNLTVNFANATGSVTLGNAASFTAGNNLSLTANLITLINSVTTQGAQSYNGNIWINGNVALVSNGGEIQLNGPVSRALTYQSTYDRYTANATWAVPSDVSRADVLVVAVAGQWVAVAVAGRWWLSRM